MAQRKNGCNRSCACYDSVHVVATRSLFGGGRTGGGAKPDCRSDLRAPGAGLRDTEAVLEVWTRDSGDWTLVQSYANGTACILAMGEAWEAVTPPPA